MRWNAIGMMLVLAAIGPLGCKQKCFVTECDLDQYRNLGLTPEVECTPANCFPAKTANTPAPATVAFPEREPRFITLLECISMALENGSVGTQSLVGRGGDAFIDQGLNFNRG